MSRSLKQHLLFKSGMEYLSFAKILTFSLLFIIKAWRMLDGSFYRWAFWDGKTDTKSFMHLFPLLIQQFCFTNHSFILLKFLLVEVFYFYFCWIILHYNKAGTVSWAGQNTRKRRGCNTQHMIGEWLYLPVVIPPISAGMQSHQDHVIWGSEKTSEKKQRLTTMAGVPTNLYRPACGGSLEAESHLICCGGTTDTPLQGA